MLFEELAELTGQRNAIDGRIVEIVAELDRDELCGATGARSVAALVAWKTGRVLDERPHDRHRRPPAGRSSPLRGGHAGGPAVAGSGRGHRRRAADGSDEHYAELAASATVSQLRTAVKLEPRPEPEPDPQPEPRPRASITKTTDEQFTYWRITLPHLEAAKFDAALQSHRDALIAEWKLDHDKGDRRVRAAAAVTEHRRGVHASGRGRLGHRGGARPHGQRTTVVVHLDVEARWLHCIWVRCSPTLIADT